MRLIDRIALNRVLKLLLSFIIRLVEICQKNKTDDSIKPNSKKRKKIIDIIVPWRNK